MQQTKALLFDFLSYIFFKALVVRVVATGKHQILPNENSGSIGPGVKGFRQIGSTAPDAEHVHL